MTAMELLPERVMNDNRDSYDISVGKWMWIRFVTAIPADNPQFIKV
jgi:hypothetical protein